MHGQRWARVHRSRAPLPFHFSLLPTPTAPGNRPRLARGPNPTVPRRTPTSLASRGRRLQRGQHTNGEHRANTDRSRLVPGPNINQRFQPTNRQELRLTRSTEQLLHASPPRLMHSLQALGTARLPHNHPNGHHERYCLLSRVRLGKR